MNTTLQDKLLVVGLGALLCALFLAVWSPRSGHASSGGGDAWVTPWAVQPQPITAGLSDIVPQVCREARLRTVRDAAGRLLEADL